MIDLGLHRIARLLGAVGNPHSSFKALHVAGTNGKGSVVSYLASILACHSVRVGKFTSPHLITEADAVSVGNKAVSRTLYLEARRFVEKANSENEIGATEFERQTAVAFEIFRRTGVSVAVVEVGLGGLLDATNVLHPDNVLCTAITKVSFDHEGFLGNTIRDIAGHKAGIMKPDVPCVVDGTNSSEVLDVIVQTARRLNVPCTLQVGFPKSLQAISRGDILNGDFQIQNAAVAAQTAITAFPDITPATVIKGLQKTRWPGRLEFVTFRGHKILVDGAHNTSAARELSKYVEEHLRGRAKKRIHWVLAFSKPCESIVPLLVQDGDTVTATDFDKVSGMPWISALDPQIIADEARKVTPSGAVEVLSHNDDLKLDTHIPTVVCGSLYMLKKYLAGGGEG